MRANSSVDGFRKRTSVFLRVPAIMSDDGSATDALILATFIHEMTLYGQTVHAAPLQCFCRVRRVALRVLQSCTCHHRYTQVPTTQHTCGEVDLESHATRVLSFLRGRLVSCTTDGRTDGRTRENDFVDSAERNDEW